MKFLEKFRQSFDFEKEVLPAPDFNGISDISQTNSGILYSLSGRIDVNNVENVSAQISTDNNIIINLKSVAYISSAGLKMMFELKKKVESNGFACSFLNANPNVYNVFKMTGFASILNIAPPEE